MIAEETDRTPTLFLDCDGVLLDVSDRYYRVHCDILGRPDGGGLGKDAFWELKRGRRPMGDVLAACEAGGLPEASYRALWLERIEADAYLGLDRPLPGVREALAALAASRPLVVVSLRQRPEGLLDRLGALGLMPFFRDVLVASPVGGEGWESKLGLLRASGRIGPGAAIVGDTEIDIRAGKAAGLRTVAVLGGIRSRELLERERPDALIEGLPELLGDTSW